MTTTAISRNNGIITELHLPGSDRGPLKGLTFVAKDVFDVKGFHTGAGNPDWSRTHEVPKANAAAVDALLAAGASLVGKTITDEIAYSVDGINLHFGAPINPQYPDRTTGGSSSGTASAVGSGLADCGIGTDTAGSVRIPASFCGLYGFRPTHGRIDIRGVVPLAPIFDTVGWMARDPEVFARCGEALLQETRPQRDSLPAKRLLIATDAFDMCVPQFKSSLVQAIAEASANFSEKEEVRLTDWGWEEYFNHFRYVQSWHAWRCHKDWISKTKPVFDDSIASRFKFASEVSEADYNEHETERQKVLSHYQTLLSPGTVLCMPTTCDLPPLVDSSAQVILDHRIKNIKLTCLASLAELPQVTIPIRFDGKHTTGFSLVGGKNSDTWLLDLTVRLAAILK
jgi:amidase